MQTWILLAALLVLCVAGCGDSEAPPAPAGTKPYNFILISIDTLRPDHLGCYGYHRETSPHIDRLANRSVLLTQARCQSPWTHPSHASLFTSLYPSVLGIRRWPNPGKIDPNVQTMAEYLAGHGYQTAGFIEGGMISEKFGFEQGFDTYQESRIDTNIPECLAWIEDRADERFFVFFHTYEVHRYKPPEGFEGRFLPDYRGDLQRKGLSQRIQRFRDYEAFEKEEDRKKIVSLYDDALFYVDDWMGRFIGSLEEMGLMKNTIIILTSDHGEEFWEHGRTGHGYTNFEELLRIPLIIYHPGLPAGRRNDPVLLLDLLPTMADMLGAPRRPEWLGRSFFPLLRGADRGTTKYNYAEMGHVPYKSVQEGRWKLIRLMRGGGDKIYDLEEDPTETKDVSGSHPEEYYRLKMVLETIRAVNEKLKKKYRSLEAVIDPALKQQLESLGYTGEDG